MPDLDAEVEDLALESSGLIKEFKESLCHILGGLCPSKKLKKLQPEPTRSKIGLAELTTKYTAIQHYKG